MPTLAELEQTPGFEKLSYNDQTLLRGEFFSKTIVPMPEFEQLTDQTKMSFFKKVTNRPPVLETKDSNFMRDAAHVVRGLEMQSPEAVKDAISLSSVRNATKQMLLPTLAAVGIDAVANLLNPEHKNDPLFEDYYGKDGTKVDQWLQQNVAEYGGEQAVKQLNNATFKLGIAGGFAEFALMVLGLNFAGAAIGGKLAAAKIAGPGIAKQGAARGASIARGILTGEHLNAATQAALTGTKLSAPLVKGLIGLTVDGVQSGVTQTGLDLLRLGLQDEFENKSNKQIWDTIAINFGANVAMNYIGYGAMKAIGTIYKANAKAIKGVTVDAVNDFKRIFRIETNPIVRSVNQDYGMDVIVAREAMLRLQDIDPKSQAGQRVIAQSKGWDLEWADNGTVRKMWNIMQPDVAFENLSPVQARRKVAELFVTGSPSDVPSAKLLKGLRGEAAMADTRTTLLRKTVLNIDDKIAPEQLHKLLLPQDGRVNKDNLQFFGQQYLKARGVPKDIAEQFNIQLFRGGKKPASSGMTSVVNQFTKSLAGEEAYLKTFLGDLDRIVKESGGKVDIPFTFRPPVLDVSQSSLISIKATAEALGVPIQTKNMSVFIDGVEFKSTRDASAHLLTIAREKGQLSIEQLDSIMSQKFGLSIKEVERPVMSAGGQGQRLAQRVGGEAELKYKNYEVTKMTPHGPRQVASAPDLATLFREHPDLDPGLPSTFAPKSWIVDPKTKTLTIENVVVTGEGTKLLELSGKYTSPISPKVISVEGKEQLLQDSSRIKYVVRNDELGVWAEYDTVLSAQRGIKEATSNYEKHQMAFAMRDMRMRYAPDGSIVAVSADGSGKRFASLDEANKWLKEIPAPSWMEELLPVDPTLMAEARKQVNNAADKLMQIVPDHKVFSASKPSKLVRGLSKFIAPTEMALSIAKRNHGKPQLLNYFREVGAGLRVVQGLDNKADAAINSIFKGVSYDHRVMYQVLVGNDPSKWNEIAQRSFKTTLTDNDRAVMSKIIEFNNEAFKAAGIPDWKYVHHYSARIRDYAEAHPDDILDAISASDYMKRALGNQPASFAFFGEHARASDVMRLALIEDSEQALRAYAYALNKHNYLEPLIKNVRTGLTQLDGQFPKAELAFFKGALDEMQSLNLSANYVMFREQTKKTVVGIQKMMRQVPGLKDTNMANEALVGDVIDMLNSRMTLATQAKPFATFRNMFQMNLLGAALGDNKIVWESLKDVLKESDDATIKRLMSQGSVRGGGFVTSQPGSNLGIWRKLMKFNENMDVLSRATAYRATERLLDSSWPLFKNGTIDNTQFLKKSGLSILDDAQRLSIFDALNRGDMAFAKDAYGDAMQRLCFFDYSKINRPTFQRGVMGKVFGKFGTYPVGAISLYERILNNGTVAERAARASRIVLNSMVIYEGMKLAGIDYNGFKWTDPFGYQGGPLWHLFQDGSELIGNDNKAKQAQNLALKTARLMSPTINTGFAALKALERIETEDYYSAAVILSGAPARKDINWTERPRF